MFREKTLHIKKTIAPKPWHISYYNKSLKLIEILENSMSIPGKKVKLQNLSLKLRKILRII